MADYVHPDYAATFKQRARRLQKLRADPSQFPMIRRYYQEHIDDFINDWGLTADPRNVRRGMPVVIPFVLDPKQREWVQWTYERWRAAEYGLTEKSRDVGLSWLVVGFSVATAVLFDDMAVGLGSFKSDKVDRPGDMGSLFEKARLFIEGLPREFRAGHEPKLHSREMRLLFPQTGSSIVGEVGDNIGRGGRTGIYFVDEAAHLEHDQLVDAALSKTTDCRQDVSSVFGMTNTFAERAHDGNSKKFTFHWMENPRFSQTDYDAFLKQWGPVITAQELDINYRASVEGIVIPAEWVNAAVDAHIKLGIKPTGTRAAALDVADRGIDKNALAGRHGILLTHAEQWSGKGSDIYATVEHAFLLWDVLACTDELIYDGDGLGAGVRGDARKINESRTNKPKIRVEAFRSSGEVFQPEREMVPGRKNEDFFENAKAQGYWSLRMRFQETYRAVVEKQDYEPSAIISIASTIPERARLCRELSQPVYTQSKAGRLLIDKQPDGVASPNLADAVMMLFAPRRSALKISPRLLDRATNELPGGASRALRDHAFSDGEPSARPGRIPYSQGRIR